MTTLKRGDKVRCVGNRGLEHELPADMVLEVEESYGCFGHEYITVTGTSRTIKYIRAHRFEKVEQV